MNNIERITGLLLIEVRNSNPNGNPESEGSPRQRPDRKGEISPVSIKRKERDLVLEKEGPVWKSLKTKLGIQDDNCFEILERRERVRKEITLEIQQGQFTSKYWDGRLFGNTFLESKEKAGADLGKALSKEEWAKMQKNINSGVAHFGVGISLAPIDIGFQTWTNKAGVEEGLDRGMAPMGFRIVRHGLYAVPFFINPNQAHKTNCTWDDVLLMLHLLRHAYPHTRSVVRSEVEVVHAHAVAHKNCVGSFSDFALIDAFKPSKPKDPDKPSETFKDYEPIPTWETVKNLPIRAGSKTTFGQVAVYVNFAEEQEKKDPFAEELAKLRQAAK